MIKFGKKTKQQVKPVEDSLDQFAGAEREKIEAYRARAKAEAKRFENATDTEFWLALCFASEADLVQFSATFGFGDLHERVRGSVAADLLADYKPERVLRGFGSARKRSGGLASSKADDPLTGVEYSGDLQADALTELRALREAFMSAEAPDPLRDVTDSDVWFLIVFDDRDHKEKFLTDFGLSGLGDKYMDGGKVAKNLRSNHA